MILHFLALWSRSADQGTAAEDQIPSFFIQVFVYKEILLLWPYGCGNMLEGFLSKKMKHIYLFTV